jgi:hypothetical protein
MTRDEILNMPEGEEIDRLVAEKVMGWHIETDKQGWRSWRDKDGNYQNAVAPYDGYEDQEDFHTIKWHPSESILWAWEVVEKLGGDKHRQWYLCTNFSSEFGNQIYAEIYEHMDESEIVICSATAETAPLAICRAALLAVTERP